MGRKEVIDASAEYVKKKLLATKRPGVKDLVKHMEDMGFFTAPCSGGNHLCCDGGLAVHTANVIRYSEQIAKAVLPAEEFKEMKSSLNLVAALHDLGKAGSWEKPYYVENMIKDGRPTKAEPEQKYKRSESKPFETNNDLLNIDHPLLSLKEADLYVELTAEEYFAILYHDGMYGNLKYTLPGHERKLQTILHYADFYVCKFVEPKFLPEEEEKE